MDPATASLIFQSVNFAEFYICQDPNKDDRFTDPKKNTRLKKNPTELLQTYTRAIERIHALAQIGALPDIVKAPDILSDKPRNPNETEEFAKIIKKRMLYGTSLAGDALTPKKSNAQNFLRRRPMLFLAQAP